MHLLESYALVAGVPISECYIEQEPIELPKSKYITFHPACRKAPARQYRGWSYILNELTKNSNFDYEIVQIGTKGDELYDVNTDYLGKTNINELAYLINNSSLHFGYDSFPIHLASHFQKKIVAVYSMPKSIAGPYFSKDEDVVILEPTYPVVSNFVNGRFIESPLRICHSNIDELDLINTVDPQLAVDGIFKLLNIKH